MPPRGRAAPAAAAPAEEGTSENLGAPRRRGHTCVEAATLNCRAATQSQILPRKRAFTTTRPQAVDSGIHGGWGGSELSHAGVPLRLDTFRLQEPSPGALHVANGDTGDEPLNHRGAKIAHKNQNGARKRRAHAWMLSTTFHFKFLPNPEQRTWLIHNLRTSPGVPRGGTPRRNHGRGGDRELKPRYGAGCRRDRHAQFLRQRLRGCKRF